MRPIGFSAVAGWLLGLVTAAMMAAAVGALIMFGIIFDTSANSPHSKPVGWAIHFTMIHSVRRGAGGQERPMAARRASLLSGAIAYERDCVTCHGGPGVARSPWVSAMLPTPPYLIDASSRWSHAELYKILHDGVKMSGMPAWGEVEDEQTISDLVGFLEWMPKVTPAQFATVRQRAEQSADRARRH